MKKTVFEVWMCCSQHKPEHYAFCGRDSRGRLRKKVFRPFGSYFIRWSCLGEFSSLEDARSVCARFHSDDSINNYEFQIREFEVSRRLVSCRSNNFSKTTWIR